jgi:hypothetical protein
VARARLRRLEERIPRPGCECGPHGHGRLAVIYDEEPEKGFQGDPDERCPRCDRPLYTVVRVVHGDEGGDA